MKKIFNYLAVMLLLVTEFTACDTDLDENPDVAGCYTLNAGFISAVDGAEYAILFNNDTVKGTVYIDRGAPAGTLAVYKKGTSEEVYNEELNLTGDTSVRFIKLGDIVDTYSEGKYTTFSPMVLFQEGQEENYQIRFNGIELKNQVENYLPKSDLTGTFEIQKNGNANPLFSQEITIDPGSQLNVMQLAKTEFLVIPEDDEPESASKQYSKIRFFYTADAFPGVNRIKVKIFEITNYTQVSELEMNVNELSPYFEMDWTLSSGLYQTLINTETDEVLLDGDVNTNAWISINNGTYKFATCRIPAGGVVINVVEGLSTRW